MQTIHLQGIGEKEAVAARELKVGDTLMWNFGYTSTIIEILKETAKSITIKTKNKDNYIGTRRLFKTTLVARVNK